MVLLLSIGKRILQGSPFAQNVPGGVGQLVEVRTNRLTPPVRPMPDSTILVALFTN
jgi:hypothetical protein